MMSKLDLDYGENTSPIVMSIIDSNNVECGCCCNEMPFEEMVQVSLHFPFNELLTFVVTVTCCLASINMLVWWTIERCCHIITMYMLSVVITRN